MKAVVFTLRYCLNFLLMFVVGVIGFGSLWVAIISLIFTVEILVDFSPGIALVHMIQLILLASMSIGIAMMSVNVQSVLPFAVLKEERMKFWGQFTIWALAAMVVSFGGLAYCIGLQYAH